MIDHTRPVDSEEWVIWNGGSGLLALAATGRVEFGPDGGRTAWLAKPFNMVGPFDLDELERTGRLDFAACIVMTRERLQTDQAGLREKAFEARRAARARMEEEERRGFGRGFGRGWSGASDDSEHREALGLPADGVLDVAQIKSAFRRLAQKLHPDMGGTHEQFIRITEARDVLLAAA